MKFIRGSIISSGQKTPSSHFFFSPGFRVNDIPSANVCQEAVSAGW
jgi:hypothetical protein